MALTEWPSGQRSITGTQPHWFAPSVARDDTGLIVFAPSTLQYGSGTPPWTVTLTATSLDANGNPGAAIPLATYATGFDFQVASASEPNGQTAVFWTVANGTYPASHAVDIQARLVDASGHPTSNTATLLTGINNLEQFRVGSVASNGSPTLLAYSVYDPTTQNETVSIAGFNLDGSAVPADARVLDSFHSYGGSAGFGFGTLTPSTGTTPSYVYLRDLLKVNVLSLGYQMIGLDGAPTGALTPIPLSFDAGSTNQGLVNWAWSRLDGPAGGKNLVTAAILTDTQAGGGSADALDIHVLSTTGGPAADDVVPLNAPGRDLAITQTANGGFVVGYVDGGVIWLRQYNNSGDVLGVQTVFTSDGSGPSSLRTLPDGRLVVTFAAASGTLIDEDVFTLGNGPVAYRVDAGVTRTIAMQAGDSLLVKAGGVVQGLTATADAQGINVQSGGWIKAADLKGGTEQVFAGGAVSHTTLSGLAWQSVVTGGVANQTVVNTNAHQEVGGVSNHTVVNAGGTQSVGQPGRDYGSTLNTGGSQMLTGYAASTSIAGGTQSIGSGGLAVGATITAGTQDVQKGGGALATTVRGGTLVVEAGGSVSRTVVQGGAMQVQAGGIAYAATADAGGTITLSGGHIYTGNAAPAALTLSGGHLTSTGSSGVSGAIAASGSGSLIEVGSGILELAGSITGPLALQADTGATLVLDQGAPAGAAFTFAGAATLQLNNLPTFSGSIAHMAAGDAIDLRPLASSAGLTPSLAYTAGSGGGTLTVTNGAKSASLALVGSYRSSDFHLASDQHGGTLIRCG